MTRQLDSQNGRNCGTGSRRCRRWAFAGAFLAVAGLTLAACDTPVQVRGHVSDPEAFNAIEPGQYTQEDVLSLLGTPSTVSTFDDRTWYYIGQKSTQFAFQHPDIFERSVLVLSFDDTGFLQEKEILSLADGRAIDPNPRETPTEGRDFTIMQQFLGNLGRLPGSGTSTGVQDVPNQ